MPGFTEISPQLFLWKNTCNVYVLRDGEAGLLIDLGDGSVLEALGELGIQRVEWVFFTHHHREQCQGAAQLQGQGVKVAAGERERAFFEQPLSFRKMRPTLEDAHTVYGASYIRPPLEPIAIDRAWAKMDDFNWRGHEFVCLHTGGNSPGHMTYLLQEPGGWVAFSGDLMLDGAKMHTWYDTEWDYGFAKGIYELGNSAGLIAGYEPALLLPSHGALMANARPMLLAYIDKLRRLAELLVRGYDIFRFAGCDQDTVSRPTSVPHVWQVTPHLFKFRGPDYWPNFHLLLAENGHGLVIDCGLFERAFLDTAIGRMKERLGLIAIDAIFVTHMHGDHALDAEHVRRTHGAQLWAMEGVADKFERPYDYDFAALLPSYSKDAGPLKFDRILRDVETLQWEEYTLTCDWMPGQTKYHSCLHGIVDGKRVAFTGDNIFASPTDTRQSGNEAVVARNGGALEEGYLYAAAYLHGIAPDLILGGHCWAMAKPAALVERMRVRIEALREAFTDLSTEDDYRYMFDPYWVQALPYRVALKPGAEMELDISVRNYRAGVQTHRIVIHAPAGLTVEPRVLEGKIDEPGMRRHRVRVQADTKVAEGLHLIALDVTRDGVRHGELFDFIAWVGDVPTGGQVGGGTPKKAGY